MRIKIASVVGFLLAASGLALRVKARDLTWWMQWRANVAWEHTVWAFWEEIWSDLGTISLWAGLALIILAFHHWIAAGRPEGPM